MPGTLLIGSPESSWREWIREYRGSRDYLCLDPADSSQGLPGRLCMFRGARPVYSRFYGSLDPQRFPHVLLAALSEALRLMDGEPIVQSFAYRPSPLLRHMTVLVSQVMQPDEILVSSTASLDLNGFPVGPTQVEIEKAFPIVVQEAQRKAQWMKLLENCTRHVVPMKTISFEGARLGAGAVLDTGLMEKIGLKRALHAEVCGSSLFVISDEEIEEAQITRALDLTHTSKPIFAPSNAYDSLFCSFVRQTGEDFGVGIVQSIDWGRKELSVLNDAVPPAPVRMLRLGAMRIDPKGRELGENRPWQV